MKALRAARRRVASRQRSGGGRRGGQGGAMWPRVAPARGLASLREETPMVVAPVSSRRAAARGLAARVQLRLGAVPGRIRVPAATSRPGGATWDIPADAQTSGVQIPCTGPDGLKPASPDAPAASTPIGEADTPAWARPRARCQGRTCCRRSRARTSGRTASTPPVLAGWRRRPWAAAPTAPQRRAVSRGAAGRGGSASRSRAGRRTRRRWPGPARRRPTTPPGRRTPPAAAADR